MFRAAPTTAADHPTDATWSARASCLNSPPDLFFPGDRSQSAAERMERAKAICRSCAVQAECLKFALDAFQEYGIWGGTDEKERQRIRRKQRLAHLVGSVPIGPRSLTGAGVKPLPTLITSGGGSSTTAM